MFTPRNKTLGEDIYPNINENEYLNELYQKLLNNYSFKLFNKDILFMSEKEISDALIFADILSKSNHPLNAGYHKVWAQEIISLANEVYPDNQAINLYMYSVLSNCTNYYALEKRNLNIKGLNFLEEANDETIKNCLKVPYHNNEHFFIDQKNIFDNFENGNYSYSAPTSMGKSFIMRVFIRNKIENDSATNFAILVPTKALINEVRSKIINELKGLLSDKNYRVVTSAGDVVLEQEHNFIFIMTPERLLYLVNSFPNIQISYLFVDEAHKICTKDSRSAFYYQLVDMLSKRNHKPYIYFSSPNIPNPEIYKDLIPSKQLFDTKTHYAPVCQFKYLIDTDINQIRVFNDHTKKFNGIIDINYMGLIDLITLVTTGDKQTIVYCSAQADAINNAVIYSECFDDLSDELIDSELLTIANDIKGQIHSDYYLVDLIKKGIAFHVGYLPSSIRLRIEKAFKDGKIKVIFCTSTLIEGVNLPADNLIITSYKNGTSNLDPVSFRNLIGRVGRLEYSLFGNVFVYRYKRDQEMKKFEELLTKKIPDQELSITATLKPKHRKAMINSLANGDIEIQNRPEGTTVDQYQFMRKMSMLLINNLINENQDSLVVTSFKKESSPEKFQNIVEKFAKEPKTDGLDITYDQYSNLREAIANGLEYPKQILYNGNNAIDFSTTAPFLEELYNIFKWSVYEKELSKYDLLPYFASIINQWMSGFGLANIMSHALKHKKNKPHEGIYSHHRQIIPYYDHTNREHRNLVFAEVLGLLEHVVLFSISNYFRAFSEEYKRFHGITGNFENDWYEYIEYGTMSSNMINLQRVGYSRESANFILNQKHKFIDANRTCSVAPFVLRKSELLNCRDEGVRIETNDISVNVKELFI